MLTKIDKKILNKYYDRRTVAQNQEEEKRAEQKADADGNANAGKLISTK